MAQPKETYIEIIVETYHDERRKRTRVRPVEGQAYPQSMVVECPRSIREAHPVGTLFRIKAKLTDREGGNPFLYSHYNWPFEVLG